MAQQAFSYRFSAKYLCLVQDSTHEWEAYIKKLNLAGYRLSNEEDSLTWVANPQTGNISSKTAYQAIVQSSLNYVHKWWYKLLWKWRIPLKFKCFMWLAFQICLKTWDNLMKD